MRFVYMLHVERSSASCLNNPNLTVQKWLYKANVTSFEWRTVSYSHRNKSFWNKIIKSQNILGIKSTFALSTWLPSSMYSLRTTDWRYDVSSFTSLLSVLNDRIRLSKYGLLLLDIFKSIYIYFIKYTVQYHHIYAFSIIFLAFSHVQVACLIICK